MKKKKSKPLKSAFDIAMEKVETSFPIPLPGDADKYNVEDYSVSPPTIDYCRCIMMWQHARLGCPLDSSDADDMQGLEQLASGLINGHCVYVKREPKPTGTYVSAYILRKKA